MAVMTKTSVISLDDFVKLQRELLEEERTAELAQSEALVSTLSVKDLTARGLGLAHLVIESKRTALYGRTAIVFKPRNQKELPSHNITNGDILGLYVSGNLQQQLISGVVTGVGPYSVEVSFDDGLDENVDINDSDTFLLVKLANDVTYKRLKRALELLQDRSTDSFLQNCLFGTSTFSPPLQSLSSKIVNESGQINFINEKLDSSQQEAVNFALLQKELAVIHGPPGTGKTTTVVEIVSQLVKSGHKVLCCAPSNIAVDNLLERLVKVKTKAVRLGHPARINQELHRYSLDAMISFNDQTNLVQDVRQDIDKALAKLKKTKSKGQRSGISKDIRDLRKELRDREKKAVKEVLTGADVVLATLTSSSPDGPLKHLPKDHFDVVVIDECSQSLELACWIALPFAKKAILAGDHQQLPPTIMSDSAAKKGLEITLMERVVALWPKVVRMLQVQYRMHQDIMQWSSKTFYDNFLVAHSSVGSHLLRDLPNISSNDSTDAALVLIDTSGCDLYELQSSDEVSKANEGEVGLVCVHIEDLIASGLSPADIAVITPYNLQVELLRLQLSSKYPTLEIRSVDGFQGREKEAVVLSLVRSNDQKELGFLADTRRLNVAVTRGRRHVCVICDSGTVSSNETLKGLVNHFEEKADVRSAMQYLERTNQLNLIRPEGLELVLKDASEPSSSQKASAVKAREPSKRKPEAKKKRAEEPLRADPANQKTAAPKGEKEKELIPTEVKKDQFEEIISQFMASPEVTYSFDSFLNSHDRMIVHEIAEKLGLFHESQGEGKNRRLVLEKRNLGDAEDVIVKDLPAEETAKSEKIVTCSTCSKSIPKDNIELHKLRCKVIEKPDAVVLSKKGKKPKKVKSQKLKGDDEDFDTLLDSFTKLDKVCNYVQCKEKTSVLGTTCSFCNIRFCLSHSMPEIHGCGDLARRAARMQISRDGKIFSGSGRPDMKPDAAKRKQLQVKLDKKLNTLSEGRKAKTNEKK